MITGDIKNQIDRIWDSFWSGGISNPLEVIEQITYLLFIRRLDGLHTLEENKANRLKKPMERRIFPEGNDAKGRSYEDYRWSRFKHFAPADMFSVVGEHLFPYLRADFARQLGNGDSTYARFTIPTPALLAKVVDLLDHVPMEERDTKGDVYEYMLAKIATAGRPKRHLGFRTGSSEGQRSGETLAVLPARRRSFSGDILARGARRELVRYSLSIAIRCQSTRRPHDSERSDDAPAAGR